MSTPGSNQLFKDFDYKTTLRRLTSVAYQVAMHTSVYEYYTKDLADRMSYMLQIDQQAKELLIFINNRGDDAIFLSLMWDALKAQTEIAPYLNNRPGTVGPITAVPSTIISVDNAPSANPVLTSPADNTSQSIPLRLSSPSVGISSNSPLDNDADHEILSVRRDHGPGGALYKVIQTEIRYGKDDNGVPYSLLAFRLETGEDKKPCLKVQLKGEFIRSARYENVNVKDIWRVPQPKNIELLQVPVQVTSTKQAQFTGGVNGIQPMFQASFSHLSSVQTTLLLGQKYDTRFNDTEGTFDVTLDLDNVKELSVVNPALFAVVLRLDRFRQPMRLRLNLTVIYRKHDKSVSKPLCESIDREYPGLESYDIVKNPLRLQLAHDA